VRSSALNRRRALAALAAGGVALAIGLQGTLSDGADGVDASDLSLRQLAGQRLIAGFNGPDPPPALLGMIRRGEVAGLILFDDNLRSRRRAAGWIRRLQSRRRPPGLEAPLLVMADQEGGLVKRIGGAPDASAAEMGRRGAAYSRRQGRLTARNLRSAGINVDLAPVLDVGRPGSAMREEQRSFGASAARVVETAIPFARALEDGGVAATAKHFPGLGAAALNTDVAVQRVQLPAAELRGIDERPYRRFAAVEGDLVMLSTAIYPALSSTPAAFSRAIATAELRRRVGFGGVSISDSLQTVAARSVGGPVQVGLAAARAGTDLLLFTDFRAAARAGGALLDRLRSGRLDRARFENSVQRVLELRDALGG
jgi:beta-N-acetylhexosaminidase